MAGDRTAADPCSISVLMTGAKGKSAAPESYQDFRGPASRRETDAEA